MEGKEKLLWEFIDGKLSLEEGKKVQKQLDNDDAFKELYTELLLFEGELKGLNLNHKIEVDLISATLSKLPERKTSTNNNISLLPVYIFLGIITIFSILLVRMESGQLQYEDTLTEFLTGFNGLSMSTEWLSSLSISGTAAILMLALPALFALDNWVSKKQRLVYSF